MSQIETAQQLPGAAQTYFSGLGITCSHYNGGALLQAADKTEAELQTIYDSRDEAAILELTQKDCAKRVEVAADKSMGNRISLKPLYSEKSRQAEAHKTAGYPADMTEYRHVGVEQTVRGGTPTEACERIRTAAAVSVSVEIETENIRLPAKRDIDAETDPLVCEQLAVTAIKALEAL